MARQKRIQYEGMLAHVGTRGDRHEEIYMDDYDRREFLGLLTRFAADAEWRVLSYCILGNHYHLLLELPHGNLAQGMHRLNSTFASRFNKRHDYVGSHLFQQRYFSKPIRDYRYLMIAFAYVARNPVEAGLCKHAELWPWSSTGALLGTRPITPVLAAERALSLIHPDRTRARERLRDAIRNPPLERLLATPTAKNISLIQRYYGLSIREIAFRLGMSKSAVGRLAAEGGTKLPGTFVPPPDALDKPPDLAT